MANLRKLAIASDSDVSSFSVYPSGRNRLKISGMFDQQGSFRALLRYETAAGGYDPPGLFQAEIRGAGHIVVMQTGAVIAELNRAQLVSDSQDVFHSGPVHQTLKAPIQRFAKVATSIAANAGYPQVDSAETRRYFEQLWLQTLQRVLLRARAGGHGGAFLLTSSAATGNLKVNHALPYNRVSRLMALAAGYGVAQQNVSTTLRADYTRQDADSIPADLYFDESIIEGEKDDAERALSEAIEFVSTLSRLDGLVLMSPDLSVRGFGVEIVAPEMKGEVTICRSPNTTKGKKANLERFGTRHRSMFRYCAANPGSLGFVLSEDGPVRAILPYGDRVLMWENIRLEPVGLDDLAFA